MAFRFPLAAVLRLREIDEEREERLLTGILTRLGQTRQAIAEIDLALAQVSAWREAALGSALPAAELYSFYERRASLEASRRIHQEQLTKLEALRLQQLEVYQRAHRGRRMLADMKAEQKNAWEAGLAHREQKTADDLFLARRGRS